MVQERKVPYEAGLRADPHVACLQELSAHQCPHRHLPKQAPVWKLLHDRRVVHSAVFKLKAAMKNPGVRRLGFVHLVVATLAVLCAYTSYKYNWLNIGGGKGDVDFWITAGDMASFSFLVSWLLLLVIIAFSSKARFLTFRSKAASWLLAIGMPVVILFLADWFFHRGFPSQPPM